MEEVRTRTSKAHEKADKGGGKGVRGRMEVILKGEQKEIAALVVGIQERQEAELCTIFEKAWEQLTQDRIESGRTFQ